MPRSSRRARISLAIAVRSLTRRERTGVRLASRVVRRSWWRRSAWWALHRFGDGLRIAVVVFVALEECSHILGGHQSGVVAEGFLAGGLSDGRRHRPPCR